MACLFGLAPDGVYPATDVTTRAVSSYLAISPLPICLQSSQRLSSLLFLIDFASLAVGEVGKSAVYFLWHFPSPRGVRPLAGILLYGARTFLSTHEAYSDCLAGFGLQFTTGEIMKAGNPDLGSDITCKQVSLHRNKPAKASVLSSLRTRRTATV
jgi:hypothetical protein